MKLEITGSESSRINRLSRSLITILEDCARSTNMGIHYMRHYITLQFLASNTKSLSKFRFHLPKQTHRYLKLHACLNICSSSSYTSVPRVSYIQLLKFMQLRTPNNTILRVTSYRISHVKIEISIRRFLTINAATCTAFLRRACTSFQIYGTRKLLSTKDLF